MRNNFITSYAASMLLCSILGIGDRHLDNICVDSDGFVIQIDLEHLYFAGMRQKLRETV